MNLLFAERFKCARHLNGFSLQDLANKLERKISRQALHKYETGDVIPDGEMIEMLCSVFNVRPDFFFTSTDIDIQKVEFRKANTLPSKEQIRIVEVVKDKVSRYLEIESILNIRTEFENPLKGLNRIDSINDIEYAAETLRKAWNIGNNPISSCFELLEDNNIKVIEVSVEDGFDGMQALINNTIPIIAINKIKLKSADRIRFTILHELGHLLLPIEDLPEKQKERYCHQFAAALLFSKTSAFKELGVTRNKLMIEELGELKKEYGISIQALVMRAKDLNIISTNYCKNFFFMFNQIADWKVNEPVEYKGKEKSTRFNQLIFRAIAEDLISINKAAVLKNQTVAEFREKSLVIS
jgi:Zn-dependent peptidase ImmA (M78 family)/DNA-binding XRE family transcriptional regulator